MLSKPKADYLEYHRNNSKLFEIDTHLDAAVWFADKYNLDIEQRCWLSFLTAICETTPTSIYLFRHFPSMETTTAERLQEFCDRNRGAMAFQYDVRWILYEIGKVFLSYKQIIGSDKQSSILNSLAKGATKETRYFAFCNHFKCYRFGTYVFMLYTELLHYLCGIDFEAVIDPRTNHSVRSGLIYACGFEDFMHCTQKNGIKPTDVEIRLLKSELSEIINNVRKLDIIKRHKSTWAIETTLCTYNKTKHGRRYLGFYKNRQAKEIKRLVDYTNNIGEKFDWQPLIEYHNNWGNWNNRYIE